ncbi:hypothetical protein SAMN04490243_0872 [Robiginitalea myxolifaciens]|uniref:Uncharacterized protein n=1 Tax=Robiginitalea myxolifaciens TaxID=400055 RepID=A0A1I6FXP2_9FLAO|nr:hypothetical protein SAMN04490243_0872 [Robiginitalea myxolifaciens]
MKNSLFVSFYLKTLISAMVLILSTVTTVVPMSMIGVL